MAPMELSCYLTGDGEVDIRPARIRRAWMDQTPKSFAYKCLPLIVANSHGWEILSPLSFEAEWTGGAEAAAIDVQLADSGGGVAIVKSHFGNGVLTFVPNVVVRTAPGYNLWIGGSPNEFKDGIQALSAVIESDWMPFTFTMNWKFTRAGHRVRFEQGEPYGFIFPVKRGEVEACDPVVRRMEKGSDLERMYRHTYDKRVNARKERRAGGGQGASRGNNWYAKGAMPDGSGSFEEHQTAIKARPFRKESG